jgi:hypothetical protein
MNNSDIAKKYRLTEEQVSTIIDVYQSVKSYIGYDVEMGWEEWGQPKDPFGCMVEACLEGDRDKDYLSDSDKEWYTDVAYSVKVGVIHDRYNKNISDQWVVKQLSWLSSIL